MTNKLTAIQQLISEADGHLLRPHHAILDLYYQTEDEDGQCETHILDNQELEEAKDYISESSRRSIASLDTENEFPF